MTIKKRAAKKVTKDFGAGKIYKIVNNVNDIIYIGSTTQPLPKRFSCHKTQATTRTTKFNMAMKEIGVGHFRIILIELFACTCKAELEAREYELTNAIDKALLYNSRFDGKHTPETLAKIKETLGEHGGNFKRGCITEFPAQKNRSAGFRFGWMEAGKQQAKCFSYPTKRTKEQAYMECMALRDEIFPLTNLDYLAELPFAE